MNLLLYIYETYSICMVTWPATCVLTKHFIFQQEAALVVGQHVLDGAIVRQANVIHTG